jgi:DNA (cytosine-5)-methyltransferase 1
MAGFKVRWANEFIPAAQEVYRANHPDTILDTRDIRTITVQEVLDSIHMQPGELDLFDGSPPCAAFSTSGKREKGWGKVKTYSDSEQRVDDLFFEFTRLLAGLQPKAFAMKAAGYVVKAKLLSAQWLGVPQARERLIYVGVRNDLADKVQPSHPKPLPYYYTFSDALDGNVQIPGVAWFPPPQSQTARLWRWLEQTGEKDFKLAARAVLGHETMIQHRRCLKDDPIHTVVQGSQCLYHPSIPRTLTIPELKRCSSFPDDFILTGSFDHQWERIGRAVPPVMMSHIAATVRDEILCKL